MFHRLLAGLALCASAGLAHAHHVPGHEDGPGSGHAHHGAGAPVAGQAIEGVAVTECWVRAMPQNLPSAAYFTLRNETGSALRLTGIASAAFGQTMLHRTVTQDGTARMQHTDAVDIPAGGTFEFAPGGYHAMLEKPTAALAPGQTISVTFAFGGDGQLTAPCAVRSPAGKSTH
ncbi:copper chaperone PCu(A)C [Verticiella sediminum]|uniref:Copper chaperone PCu(A)C n=1 Tax=Verticiella sediminum TaxID=1247510 RepID=A0A556B0C5_9BURK|nr:copper chaperone PCu(A)C [Verticiella sediminum]TSH98646.1 copper chaperone PCu(A)C [Verticiella sediminum]